MKLVYDRPVKKVVEFESLKIGDAYIDASGIFCIKTSKSGDCIAMIDGTWLHEFDYDNTLVEPVEATITVEG